MLSPLGECLSFFGTIIIIGLMLYLIWKNIIKPWILVTFYGYKRVIEVYDYKDGKYYHKKTIEVDE